MLIEISEMIQTIMRHCSVGFLRCFICDQLSACALFSIS